MLGLKGFLGVVVGVRGRGVVVGVGGWVGVAGHFWRWYFIERDEGCCFKVDGREDCLDGIWMGIECWGWGSEKMRRRYRFIIIILFLSTPIQDLGTASKSSKMTAFERARNH